MRIRLIPPLILAALLGLASGTPAHVGDEIYLSRYDDGSAVAPSSWGRIKAALR